MIRIELVDDTIRFDRTEYTVEYLGLKGTYVLESGLLTMTWSQMLGPESVEEPYTPVWEAHPDQNWASWTVIDEDTVRVENPSGEITQFFRCVGTHPSHLLGSWKDYDGYRHLTFEADGSFTLEDTRGESLVLSAGTWESCQGYLCLHVTEKSGYLPGTVCDFFHISAYSYQTDEDSPYLRVDFWVKTEDEGPQSVPIRFDPWEPGAVN